MTRKQWSIPVGAGISAKMSESPTQEQWQVRKSGDAATAARRCNAAISCSKPCCETQRTANIYNKMCNDQKQWLTTRAAADYLGVKTTFLRNLRESGRLHYYKVGKMIFYKKKDIDRLINDNKIV